MPVFFPFDQLKTGVNVVPLETMEQRLWPGKLPKNSHQRLREIIKNLRDILGESVETPCWIETVSTVGYVFVATAESTPAGQQTLLEAAAKTTGTAADSSFVEQSNSDIPVSEGGETGQASARPTQLDRVLEHLSRASVLVVFAALGVAVLTQTYGLAALGFAVTSAFVISRYLRSEDTLRRRALLVGFLVAAMSYLPSASTLVPVVHRVINIGVIRPALAYPFVTGLKFIPLFVLILGSCVLLGFFGDFGFRKIRRFGRAYIVLGIVFVIATSVAIAIASGEYQMWRADVPGIRMVLIGYFFVFLINIAVWIYGYRFLNRDRIPSYRPLFLGCVAAYMPLAFAAAFIDYCYNGINEEHLSLRRPEMYVAGNPDAINAFKESWLTSHSNIVGGDLAALLNDPAFHRVLVTKRFYRQDFDEAFQVIHHSVMFGYDSNPHGAPRFVVIRFPDELASALRFQPVGTVDRLGK